MLSSLRSRASIGWAIGASALLHLGGVWALKDVASWFARSPVRAPVPYEARFEPVAPGRASGDRTRRSAPPEVLPGSDPSAGALDRMAQEGRGGDLQAEAQPSLLFPFVSPLTLQDTELNNLAVNQAQRIDTSVDRATLEERRASPNAADEVLLASGSGEHRERRQPSRADAVEGAPRAHQPSAPSEARAGGELAPGAIGSDLPTTRGTAAQRPREAARYAPARGIDEGRGPRESPAARVVTARPNVDRGPAATTSEQLDPRARDDLDAELLAAQLQRSLVDTSVQRAPERGPGMGGGGGAEQGLGVTGQGGGARARPYAPGSGSADALDTSDARYLRWFTQQRARVQKELVFPRARALAKDQGTTLYRVVLGRDGSLSGKPRLVRSSGFSDFDAAAAIAIERALPFAPLPKELAPALDSIALLIPVAFSNPMVE